MAAPFLTRSEIAAEIAANLPDNNSELITPAIHRTTLGDISQSSVIYSNDAYIVVPTTNDPEANMRALIEAYQAASALTPNGAALAIDNRACVIVPPGRYKGYFNEEDEEWITFDMLNNFVDVVSLTGYPADVLITSACDASNSGTVVLVANFAILKGVTIQNTASTRINNNETDACALCFGVSQSGVSYIDCVFDDGAGASWGMRQNITADSNYIRCVGQGYCFGANGGEFSGTATDCTAGIRSFGNGAQLTGTVKRCSAGDLSFGTGGIGASAYLEGCIGGSQAFAANGPIFSGARLVNCRATSFSFGDSIQSNVVLIGCESTGVSFGRSAFSGLAIGCVAYSRCFGADGTFNGQAINCVAAQNSYGGNGGTMSGEVIGGYLYDWDNAYAPAAFSGLFSGVRFEPSGTDKNAVTLPDGATGEFEYCTFKKTGSGTPVGLATGTATTKFSYCKFNTVAGLAAGITNPLGATLADAFNIGNTSV